jgi:hypothetical protein
MLVTVAEGSKAWTVFARSDAVIVGSNPASGMDVWCLCCVCVFLCLCTGTGLAMIWSPVQGVLLTVLDLVTEVKRKVSWRRPRPKLGCRAKGKEIVSYPRRRCSLLFKFSFPCKPCKIATEVARKFFELLVSMLNTKIFSNHVHQQAPNLLSEKCLNTHRNSARLSNILHFSLQV